MESVLEFVKYLLANGPAMLGAFMALLSALIAFFMLIPGEQPEKSLKVIDDFLGKFSKK